MCWEYVVSWRDIRCPRTQSVSFEMDSDACRQFSRHRCSKIDLDPKRYTLRAIEETWKAIVRGGQCGSRGHLHPTATTSKSPLRNAAPTHKHHNELRGRLAMYAKPVGAVHDGKKLAKRTRHLNQCACRKGEMWLGGGGRQAANVDATFWYWYTLWEAPTP